MRSGHLHIAIVDDDSSVRKGLQRLLEAAGLAGALYSSGEAFLHSLRYRKPDCLLLDLKMPGLSGFEVLQKLRRGGSRIPTIIFSAHDGAETRQQCLTAGAATFLAKPIEGRGLLAAIDRVTAGNALAAFQADSTNRVAEEH